MSEILYNVTVNVSDEKHLEWVRWMQEVHIAEVLATGCFSSARLMRVHAFEQGGKTYAVQYISDSMESYERYQREHAAGLQSRAQATFGDHMHAFRTVLEVLSHYRTK